MLFPLLLLAGFLTACTAQREQPPTEQEGNKPVEQQEGSKPSEQIEQDANKLGGKIESTLLQAKQEYEAKLEARVNEFDNKMNELKNKAASSEAATKAEMDQAIADLAIKREETAKKIEELKAASADSWENLKSSIDAAVDTLEKSYEEAVSKFK